MTLGQARASETLEFDGLTITFDERVLRPRPWTAHQSRWAAELLSSAPEGAVLELCAGAGQIGLAAVRRSARTLICVDIDPVASAFALDNARIAGLTDRVEARTAPLLDAVRTGESFPLILADPPWVRRGEVARYPEDPRSAIDGGDDGLAVARQCVDVVGRRLVSGGSALLQLGDLDQVCAIGGAVHAAGLLTDEVRTYGRGVVVRLERAR